MQKSGATVEYVSITGCPVPWLGQITLAAGSVGGSRMKWCLVQAAALLCLGWFSSALSPVYGQTPQAVPQAFAAPTQNVGVTESNLYPVPSPAILHRVLRSARFSARTCGSSVAPEVVPAATPVTAPSLPTGTPDNVAPAGSARVDYTQKWAEARKTGSQVGADFSRGMRNLGLCLTGLCDGLLAAGEGCRQAVDRLADFSESLAEFCRKFHTATAAFSNERAVTAETLTPSAPADAELARNSRIIAGSGYRYLWVHDGGGWFGTDNPRLDPGHSGEQGWRRIDTTQVR